MRYIVDTDDLIEVLKGIPPAERGDYFRKAFSELHEGRGNFKWVTRIKGTKKEGDIYTPEFETFWSAYPKKVGKGGSFRSWQKIKMDKVTLLHRCQDALQWQTRLDQWVKDGGQFIPNPQTYLNQARYEDEMPPEFDPDKKRKTITTMDGRVIEV